MVVRVKPLKRVHCLLTLVPLAVIIGGCDRTAGDSPAREARYVVTVDPIDLGIGSGRFCVAIEPGNPRGVWWWEPGKDCSTRSTGPGVFHAEGATVSPSARAGATEISFRVQLIRRPNSVEPPFAHVVLQLDGGHLQSAATGSRVATAIRHDLQVSSAW